MGKTTFAFIVLLLPALVQAGWYDTDWEYRQELAILPALADADLADFPYLVKITDPTNPLFAVAQSGGEDILFTADDGTTKLDHEIERYSNSAKELYAWVHLDSLSSSVVTEIYIYYGNGSVSDQQNPTAVWDSTYEGVWHLDEDSLGTGAVDLYEDVTTSTSHGIDSVSATGQDGQVDGGQQFDGVDDFVDLDAHIGKYASLSEGTISIWFRYTDTSDYKLIFSASCNTDNNSDIDIMYYLPDDVFMWGIREDGVNVVNCSFPASYADGLWHHYVLTVDVSGNKHYVDGSQITCDYKFGGGAATQAFFDAVTDLNTLRFGNREDYNGNQYHYAGNLDEVRISSIARGEDWIEASYRNQNTPGIYQALSSEQQSNKLVVDTEADSLDGDTTSVVHLLEDRGVDSLVSFREAIIACNNTAGADTIDFAIDTGVQTIQPDSALPEIVDTVMINGASQPGYTNTPLIVLDGSNILAGANGLTIKAGGSTVKGLVINSFWGDGIELDSLGGNTIVNCFVGTNQAGSAADANWGSGVLIRTGSNMIGGTDLSDRNILSGNWGAGVDIRDAGAAGNEVYGNYIGVDSIGTSGVGNGNRGVSITGGAATNLIGGTGGKHNVISGNSSSGVLLQGGSTTGNRIVGNYIGTNAAGTGAVPNTMNGVMINSGASSNFVGGITPGAGNVISGNGAPGVRIDGPTTDDNEVLGNLIGTNASGTAGIPNTSGGVSLSGNVTSTTVGGTAAGAGNVVSGNNGYGIRIESGAILNTIKGNLVGTDSLGTAKLANTGSGIEVLGAGNTVGGSSPGAGNVISGNDWSGILLSGNWNTIVGNYVGTDTSATFNLGNANEGIELYSSAANNTVGGTTADSANTIAFSGGDGIDIKIDAGTGNALLGNSIFSNTELGIDIAPNGVNANDDGDGDSGANALQNFPVLSAAVVSGGSTTISGSLNSLASKVFHLEFFSSATADPTGYGEGETSIGDTTVTTDAGGDVAFSVTFPVALTLGHAVSATATDLAVGNTSEFSDTVGPQVPNLSVFARETTFAFGVNTLDNWLSPQTSAIINNGNVSEDFVGQISQFTDGSNTWDISDAANGADSVRTQWSTVSDTGPWTDISAYDTDFTIATGVAVDDSVVFYVRIQTPNATSSYNEHSSTLTVTAQEY